MSVASSLRRQPSLRRTSSSVLPTLQSLPPPPEPLSPKKVRRRPNSTQFPQKAFILLLFGLLCLTVTIGKAQFARSSPFSDKDDDKDDLLSDQQSLTFPRNDSSSFYSVNPLLGLAPRRTLYSPRGSRQPPNSTSSPTSIHAVMVCRAGSPCCRRDVGLAVGALRNQTLVPEYLTFVHACRTEKSRNRLRRAVRTALDLPGQPASSYALLPSVADHSCGNVGLAECVLRYLGVKGGDSGRVLLLDSSVVLEPIAVEKMWLAGGVLGGGRGGVRPLGWDWESLKEAEEQRNPLVIRKAEPGEALQVVPVMYRVETYREAVARVWRKGGEVEDHAKNWMVIRRGERVDVREVWAPFVEMLGKGRVLREALYTSVGAMREGESFKVDDLFSFEGGGVERSMLPAHLFSEIAFQRWSAQHDEDNMYAATLYDGSMDLRPVKFPVLKKAPDEMRIFLVLPWMEMGGSEKCMLDIAKKVLAMEWSVTFVFTMPFWHEDAIGERGLKHDWLSKALLLSADVFDLLALSAHQHSTKAFRHLIESRQPDFLLMSNTRWGYGNSGLIKALSPRTIVADYNHMIHMSWEGGGMPRYGANHSAYFDLHLTASKNVANAMHKWIQPELLKAAPEKIQPCYIGTDPQLLYEGDAKFEVRTRMRLEMAIEESDVVVLFAGRFVIDKGLDVVAQVITDVALHAELTRRLVFVFVGSGTEEKRIRNISPDPPSATLPRVIIRPPARGIRGLRDYYALSDILLLPSVNEGIALVAYEAMASGVLVMTTDVGGQKELVTPDTGILLPNYNSITQMSKHTLEKLKEVAEKPDAYAEVARAGQELVRTKYTTESFCTCVVDNLNRVRKEKKLNEVGGGYSAELPQNIKTHLISGAITERFHGLYNLNAVQLAVDNMVTIGVKTYVCDQTIVAQVAGLVRSIRVHYPHVRLLLGNDGPIPLHEQTFVKNDSFTEEIDLPKDCGISFGRNYMVNLTTTRYFVLLDDDHVFDDTTNLTTLVNGIQNDGFDLVGMRIRNLPGIDELERSGIVIPRYVAMIKKLENRELTLCVWNENKGPSIYGITHPIPVDVLHNAFIGNTEALRAHPWRNELVVNEHMTFFLDARDAGLRIGYLPSVFVHHHAREYSDCYYKVRFREEKYRNLLPYDDQFLWDMKCNAKFPGVVRNHILKYELEE